MVKGKTIVPLFTNSSYEVTIIIGLDVNAGNGFTYTCRDTRKVHFLRTVAAGKYHRSPF